MDPGWGGGKQGDEFQLHKKIRLMEGITEEGWLDLLHRTDRGGWGEEDINTLQSHLLRRGVKEINQTLYESYEEKSSERGKRAAAI